MDVFSADWPGICRRIVAAQRAIFAATASSEERTVYEGVGEGGDHTLVIDRAARTSSSPSWSSWRAAGRLLRRRLRGARRGRLRRRRRGAGRDRPDRRLAQRAPHDPLPQPQHRRRLRADSMADVEFGFVHDFGADEEFVAHAAARAPRLGGERDPGRRRRRAARGRRPGVGRAATGRCRRCAALEGKVYRLRVVGSIAITAAYVAAGRFDAMLSLRPCRSVDAAAAQLIVREAGGAVAFGDLALDGDAARPRRPLPDRRRPRRGRAGHGPRRPGRLSARAFSEAV